MSLPDQSNSRTLATETTAVTDTRSLQVRPVERHSSDALVQIYPPGTNMGHKWDLPETPFVIGRDTSAGIVLEANSVSRQHAILYLENGHRILRDLTSTNGTYVNDTLIDSVVLLKRGDQLKIGEVIFKYLAGSDLETAYHEEIYRISILDGLSGVYNQRYFHEEFDREIARARRFQRCLSLVFFEIDQFGKISDTFGCLAGDYILKSLCGLIREHTRTGDTLARYGANEFAILLPESQLKSAVDYAHKLVDLVQGADFEFDGSSIPAKINVGIIADENSRATLSDFIEAARNLMINARNRGTTSVLSKMFEEAIHTGRRVGDAELTLHKVLHQGPPCAMVGCEIADETRILGEFGRNTVEAWRSELRDCVLRCTKENMPVSVWKDRFVFIFVPSHEEFKPQSLIRNVLREWVGSEGESNAMNLKRLNWEHLSGKAIEHYRERSLEQLVGRIVKADVAHENDEPDWSRFPFPVAVVPAMISARKENSKKMKTTYHGIENLVKLAVAAMLGINLEGEEQYRSTQTVVSRFQGILSMGGWRDLAFGLYECLPEKSSHSDLLKAIHQLFSRKLRPHLERVLSSRNAEFHHESDEEAAYALEAAELFQIFNELTLTFKDLTSYRLISVEAIKQFGEDDEILYDIRQHVGDRERFPVTEYASPYRMQLDWCYLIREGEPPVCLAPIVFSKMTEDSKRIEVLFAREVRLAPPRAFISGVSVTSKATAEIALPRFPHIFAKASEYRSVDRLDATQSVLTVRPNSVTSIEVESSGGKRRKK